MNVAQTSLGSPTCLQCLLCRKLFAERKGPVDRTPDWAQATKPLDDHGIAELVRIAEGTVDDERLRGRQLDTKTASLGGFSGLILSIDTVLARSMFDLDLGSAGNVIARSGFVISALALLTAVSLAIAGVQMPQKYRSIGRKTLDEFTGPDSQSQSPTEIRRALLQALALNVAQDRVVNDCKARLTKGIAVALLAGFVGLTAAAITLAGHSIFS
jgi:hypothetical protein